MYVHNSIILFSNYIGSIGIIMLICHMWQNEFFIILSLFIDSPMSCHNICICIHGSQMMSLYWALLSAAYSYYGLYVSKIIQNTYTAHVGCARDHISNKLTPYEPRYTRRSCGRGLLLITRSRLKTRGGPLDSETIKGSGRLALFPHLDLLKKALFSVKLTIFINYLAVSLSSASLVVCV